MFKRCPACFFEWPRRIDFLSDASLEAIGYQVNFGYLTAGFFLFNHDCNTTLAVPADAFKDLYDGPIFKTRATGSRQCPGHCFHENDLAPCPASCECAYVREILQVVREWPKNVEARVRGV